MKTFFLAYVALLFVNQQKHLQVKNFQSLIGWAIKHSCCTLQSLSSKTEA